MRYDHLLLARLINFSKYFIGCFFNLLILFFLKKKNSMNLQFNLPFAVRYPESSSAIHRSSLLVANSASIKSITGIAINDNKI